MPDLKHRQIIDALTLEEKASLLSGANFWNTKPIERLGIPSIMLTDGPHGLRKQGGKADHLGLNASIPATCFPTALTLAASWDTDLVQKVGQAIGTEAAAEQVSVLLGPGLNIIRNPLGGRTFEYFSEDPYLAGKLAAASVCGIQSTGVAASPKHYAVNSQEYLRMSIDEVVDERSLHEIYLEGFRRVVQEARPRTIMSAYNKVNGVLANENQHLLTDILKKDWGFDGVIVTDWGGEDDRIAGLKAGNQLEMPSTNGITDREVMTAIHNGQLDEAMLDTRINDILELIEASKPVAHKTPEADLAAHHELAIEAARRSIVLLKNDAQTLPLKAGARVAIIGDFAQSARYQGAGSSLINPTRLEHALDHLYASSLDIVGFEPGFTRSGKKNTRLHKRAVALASRADIAVLFLGLDEGSEAEGVDRTTMRLPDVQLTLVDALRSVNNNIIVVLAGGGPVELPFADDISALLHSQLAGQGSGKAVVDVLMGAHNPSGKLAVSYPLSYSDVPSARYFPGQELTSEHREGLYVGYRYYDTTDTPVRYPFGHGLSYTAFEYSDPQVTKQVVKVTITNTGEIAGDEIVQVYIRPETEVTFRPRQELKGFAKVHLEPGESQEVSIPLDDHAFAFYHIGRQQWIVAPGKYSVAIGSSSRDIRCTSQLTINGDSLEDPYDRTLLDAYYAGAVQDVSDEAFATLLGRELPTAQWNRHAPLTEQDTIRQLSYSNLIGKACYGLLIFVQKFYFTIGKPLTANNLSFIINMPFYKLERFTGGKVSRKGIRRFLKIVNR